MSILDMTILDMAERNCHLGQGVETAPHRGQQLAVLGPGVVVVQVPAAETNNNDDDGIVKIKEYSEKLKSIKHSQAPALNLMTCWWPSEVGLRSLQRVLKNL